MARADYEKIKSEFEKIVLTFRSHDTNIVKEVITDNANVQLGTIEDSRFGYCGKDGFVSFVKSYPNSKTLNIDIANFVCHIRGNEARQLAYVVMTAIEDGEYYLYCHIFVNHWVKEENWKLDDIKMEVYDNSGSLKKKYQEVWHFEDQKCKGLIDNAHPLVIDGNVDSPWKFSTEESELNEFEKIKDAITEYNYGVDLLAFDHVDRAFSNDLVCTGTAEIMGVHKHDRMAMLKYHRQTSRIWAHAYKYLSINIHEDEAIVHAKRLVGERHPEVPFQWTDKSSNKEVICADLDVIMSKKTGRWQIKGFAYENSQDYFDLNKEGLYRDLI